MTDGRRARIAVPDDDRRVLRSRLRSALIKLGAADAQLRESDALAEIVLPLYDLGPSRIWLERICPFVARHQRGLANLFDEHRVLPDVELLDYVEVLLLLDRLSADEARLADAWVLSGEALGRLAAAWGLPLPRVA